MVTQLNLFTDKTCAYCGGGQPDPKNPLLWDGFLDQDTKELVCRGCKGKHYWAKARAMGTATKDGEITAMTYSEFPVYNKNF